ncbi:UNVERIFIED_CONTAM: hypothetical protein RF648_19860, partial [Kocuria sp. CPCC 205274]
MATREQLLTALRNAHNAGDTEGASRIALCALCALRKADNAGDTEGASRIANMIKSQGGSNAPTEQPQPQPAAPQAEQPQQTQAPTNTDSTLENAFNYVGNVAASGGRMLAGGVAELANVGVGAANAVQSAGAWAGKQLGLGDGTY